MQLIKNEALHWAHPLINEWFSTKLGRPTEPQIKSWPAILAGKPTLISAPTGSGKTLAAFLACLDHLVRKALHHQLDDETEVLYISPLKALGNDIQKNLLQPLKEISELSVKYGLSMQEIRVAVRTGDTLAKERAAVLKKPPHILITTPESFYILLTAQKSREMLKTIKTVIVDEIHALANDKRGSHLLLSLERLEALTTHPPIRIGLSATQKPIEKIGQFLVGSHQHLPELINMGHARHLDLAIEVPATELTAVASHEMWDEMYDRLTTLIHEHRSTLIFVNTRRLAERLAHHIGERIGEEWVAAHHGSLSRRLRLEAETRLKNGELKALVATASLELGIDIGTIDLVCQIGSPRSIATALQRVGRAGHWQGALSKGRFFVTTRDELVECSALIYAIKKGDLDELIIPDEPLDILAQQIVATCATGDWREEDLFNLVKRAYPYKNLSRKLFNTIIEMLTGGITGSRGRYGAYLFRDQVNGLVKARRGSRLIAITNGGAIPETGLFTVIAEREGIMVGTLDEDFAVESNRGDIFLLGSTSWQVNHIESRTGKVFVEDAHGAPPSIPFWRGEAPTRTKELSYYVSHLRETLNDKLSSCSLSDDFSTHKDITFTLTWLEKNINLNHYASEQLIKYLLQGRAVLGAIPTQKTIIAERFFDESGGMQLVIHAPFGARINKAWGLALRKRFCRSFNFELQAAATDDGLNISLAEQHSFPLADVFQFLQPQSLEKVLTQAVLQSPLFKTRWRWDANRALALLRFRYGKKIPPNIQRMLADDLLAAVFPDAAACQDNLAGKEIILPDHPLINETIKDCLTESLDLPGLLILIDDIVSGKIACLAVDTPLPSPFSQQILNANPYAFLDDAPLEERRARAVEMRRFLPDTVLEKIGRLDKAAIDDINRQAWPDIRNADELHDFLQTVIALPENVNFHESQIIEDSWQIFFVELKKSKRASEVLINDKKFWVAAEKAKTYLSIFPHAIFVSELPEIETSCPQQDESIMNLLRGWMLHLGPISNHELSQGLGLEIKAIDQALLKLESTGFILRGHFRQLNELEWCERRLLARIHRLTLEKLRKEISPVSIHHYMHWLLTWQHLTPDTKLQGEKGLLEILKQLQGLELPANIWESHILSKRIKDYHSDLLDQLTLRGAVGWGRLSRHPVMNEKQKMSRVIPRSNAPISFFVREEAQWLDLSHLNHENDFFYLSHVAKSIYYYLQKKGASFFFDIANHVSHLKSEIENGLWELVTAGLVTADNFDDLRRFIDRGRRLQSKKRKRLRTSMMSSRWSLLYSSNEINETEKIEASCWLLLKRYGVVFRDLLSKEKNIPSWRELRITFRLLEDRGEIRSGRFVEGVKGEQFALPYAVQSLRIMRDRSRKNENFVAEGYPLNLIENIKICPKEVSSSRL